MVDEYVADVVVVGGGPIGLATAWQVGRRGLRVLVIDQYGFLHDRAGSSGTERHWRIQYTQKDIFSLTLQSRDLWRGLESHAGRSLVHEIGSLWFGDVTVETSEGHIVDTARAMDDMSLRYEWLTASEIERRYGFAHLPRDFEGFFQAEGGTIDVRSTVATLLRLAQQEGACLSAGEKVGEVCPESDSVVVRTSQRTLRAGKVVLAANAGVNELIRPWDGRALDLGLYEMALVTVKQKDAMVRPFWYVFQQPTDEDCNLFYGFPPNPWAGTNDAHMGPDFEIGELSSADEATGTADPRHVERVGDWARTHVPWVDSNPVATSTCLGVVPRDLSRQFYLGTADRLVDGGQNVVVCAGGWTFKLIPLFGEVCADLAIDGRTSYDVARHGLTDDGLVRTGGGRGVRG